MRVATILTFLFLSFQAIGQDTLNDLSFEQTNDFIKVEMKTPYQWGNLEVWDHDGHLIFTATLNPKGRQPLMYLLPKAALAKTGALEVSVYVTRLHKGMVFRDNINQIDVTGRNLVRLRPPGK